MLGDVRGYLTLVRWLGPWASEARIPLAFRRRRVRIQGGPTPSYEAWMYTPSRGPIRGAYVIAPGLHYAGPADPRMNRFCSILATSGIAVLAPFLPDYTALRVTPKALADFDAAFATMLDRPELPADVRPGVFSISFGSLLALRLAASEERRDQVGSLVLFGGYADWSATIRFCLTGEIDGHAHIDRDPLNQPVVFMNLIDDLNGAPAEPAALLRTWRRYVEATWGRPEMKVDGRHIEVARRYLADVPADQRELYLTGCGALPGGYSLCTAALERSTETAAFLDPRPYLPEVRCPVHLVHGIDDDVIPYVESERLRDELAHTECQLLLTGLYGHTTKSGKEAGSALAQLPDIARELWTMGRIVGAMIGGASRRG